MRSYLTILALAICICAVSSRSLRTFLNEDDSDELQQRTDRRNLNEALLLNRLRKLLDNDDEITNTRDIQSQSDESSAQDDTAGAVRRGENSDSESVEVARKKRQLLDQNENNDESDQSTNNENNAPESVSQDEQTSDDSEDSDEDNDDQSNTKASGYLKYSDEENEQQPNNQATNYLKYSDEENEDQSNKQATDDSSEEVDDE